MSLLDKLSAGAERAAKEAEKAFDKGKAKVGELQLEMQMDGKAKKLGYLVFDFYRGRQVDQDERQRLLDELSRLEDQLIQARAEAAAKARAAAGGSGSGETGGAQGAEGPSGTAGAAPGAPSADASAAGAAPDEAPSASPAEGGSTPGPDNTWPQADA